MKNFLTRLEFFLELHIFWRKKSFDGLFIRALNRKIAVFKCSFLTNFNFPAKSRDQLKIGQKIWLPREISLNGIFFYILERFIMKQQNFKLKD